ncbi:MAG: alkaline phosphatase D family protein [Phenylobacterium sp.]|uniref:alkaline phosphatase D family protein n=1 Tax=Phenylobacterium sp. TaxID=1871053 RepID=UPI001A5E1A27|nr:alkaline phosphatase D family protein [Phenylobacterium sp.]MBL8556996.1 alkaline phosphatase D family protein [Phenylobacterium sp.]
MTGSIVLAEGETLFDTRLRTGEVAIERRRLLTQAAWLAGVALTPAAWTSAVAQTRMADYPFGVGVTSGDPTSDGVVLWTRIAPRPREPDYGMDRAPVVVTWEVAEDAAMARVVRKGEALAVPEGGHSAHVEVAGLKPDREYFYRFMAGGHTSPVGRTRTAPAAGAPVDRLTLAYGSCQKYETGFYSAHAAIAAERPDLILFLGDYIYEGAATKGALRAHPPTEPVDLAGYRQRYAWYRTDTDLQAAHAAAPWMVIWDDHEVVNDYGDDQDRSNPDPKTFLRRRAAAYQAYFENMPLRRRQIPVGPDMQLYRSLDWGNLARLSFLDTRQERDRRTCEAVSEGKRIPYACPDRTNPRRSLLGRPQERWLEARLRKSPARWNVLAQQYLMGELKLEDGRVSNDGWDGYAQTRRRILETWRDARTPNPIALGGDIHCFFAGDLGLEPGRPIASEFVGGSISSLGTGNDSLAASIARNPHLKYAEGQRRGYGRLELTAKACEVTFRGVQNAFAPGSPVNDLAKFVVEAGQPGLQRA